MQPQAPIQTPANQPQTQLNPLVPQLNQALKDTQAAQQAVKSVKAGYKTSEFWLHLVIQLATWIVNLNASTGNGHLALTGFSVVSLLGYITSRTVVKKV